MQNFLSQWQIDEIFKLGIQAGEIAKTAFLTNNFEIFIKKDNSKVSSVDLQISELIYKNLSKICPNIPIICEEALHKNLEDIHETFFLIDPIDGTSSFINNSNEFCINIALIHKAKPIFGFINAPLYEDGKVYYNNNLNQIIFYNLKKNISEICHYQVLTKQQLKIVTSIRTKDEDIKNFIQQFYPQFINNFSLIKLSSAIKFFKIIDGTSNVYLHTRKSMEWDIASGHALINIIQLHLNNIYFENNNFYLGDELQYKKKNFINNSFVINAL